MKSKEEIKSIAKEYFAMYPNEQSLLVTADGLVFLNANRGEAKDHGRRLGEEPVVVKRRDAEFPEAEPTPEVEPAPEAEPVPEVEPAPEAEPVPEVEPKKSKNAKK